MDYNELSNIKCAALNYAIKSACGTEQNENCFVTTNAAKLVEAAKIFEAYIGETDNAHKT